VAEVAEEEEGEEEGEKRDSKMTQLTLFLQNGNAGLANGETTIDIACGPATIEIQFSSKKGPGLFLL